MPLSYIFWLLIILWAIFGVGYGFVTTPDRRVIGGGNLLLFILIVLLGLQSFGSAIK